MMKNKFKNSKAITLIALVVTIIVLLILAGVTISTLTGKDGTLNQVKNANEQNKISELTEKLELKKFELASIKTNTNITLDEYLEYLEEENIINKNTDLSDTGIENSTYVILENKYIFLIENVDNVGIIITYKNTGEAEKLAFTLIFDANQGIVDIQSKKIRVGDNYGELPMPTREEYIFLGWFTQPTGGTQVTDVTVMDKMDVTIYAQWKLNFDGILYNAGVVNSKYWALSPVSILSNQQGSYSTSGTNIAINTWFPYQSGGITYTIRFNQLVDLKNFSKISISCSVWSQLDGAYYGNFGCVLYSSSGTAIKSAYSGEGTNSGSMYTLSMDVSDIEEAYIGFSSSQRSGSESYDRRKTIYITKIQLE